MKTLRHAVRGERGYTLVELMLAVAILSIAMGAILSMYTSGNTIAMTGENKAEAQQGARGTLQIEEDLKLAGYGYPPGTTVFAPTTTSPSNPGTTTTSVSFWGDLVGATTTLTLATPANCATSNSVNVGDKTFTVVNGSGFAAGNTIYLINEGTSESLTVSSATATSVTVSNSAGAVNSYPCGAQVGLPRQITYSWDGTSTITRDAGDGNGPQTAVTGVTAFSLTYYDQTDTAIAAANIATNLANIRRVVIGMTAQSTVALNRGRFTLTSSVRPRNVLP